MKHKTLKILTVAAVALSAAVFLHNQNTKYRLEAEMDLKSISELIQQIDTSSNIVVPYEKFDLILGTQGGNLNQTFRLLKVMSKSGLKFNTHVDFFTASAGALLFLQGKERTMSPDAQILFHRGRINLGGLIVTRETLSNFLNGIPSDKLTDTLLRTAPAGMIEKMLDSLVSSDEELFAAVKRVVGEEKASLLLPVNGSDVILTAQEALEMGIATAIKD